MKFYSCFPTRSLLLLTAIILFVLFLTGCASSIMQSENTFSRSAASDGYRFVQKDYETLQPGVQFVLMRNEEEYREVMRAQFGNSWKKISAFTSWNRNKATCKIYIKDPAWEYTPELIGHEVAHCIWGRFHDGENGKGDVVSRWTRTTTQ